MRERAYRRQRPTQRPADPTNTTCHSSPGSLRLENHEFHTSLRCIMKPRKRGGEGKMRRMKGEGKGEGGCMPSLVTGSLPLGMGEEGMWESHERR